MASLEMRSAVDHAADEALREIDLGIREWARAIEQWSDSSPGQSLPPALHAAFTAAGGGVVLRLTEAGVTVWPSSNRLHTLDSEPAAAEPRVAPDILRLEAREMSAPDDAAVVPQYLALLARAGSEDRPRVIHRLARAYKRRLLSVRKMQRL